MTKQSFVIGEYSVICTLYSVLLYIRTPSEVCKQTSCPSLQRGTVLVISSRSNSSPKAKRHRWKTQLKLFCFTGESEDCLPCGALYFLNNALPHKFRSAVKQKKRLSVNAGSTEESCLQIVSKEPADCFSRVPKFLALFASKSAESTTAVQG